ncbi:aggregation-promoting factor C-terminal-like domain-containing protein, partial [Streptomyces mexicanus]
HVGPAFQWLSSKVIQPVWSFIKGVISGAWTGSIKPTFGLLQAGVRGVGDVFTWLRDHAVTPAWNTIKATISTVWQKGIKPAFDALKVAVGKVGDAFGDAKDAIGKAWDKIKKLTKDPINFVLGTVWNEGIVKVWKKIGGWIPGLPKLATLPLLAEGGMLPVQPGVFNSPTAIVGEGNPRYPEFVIPTDPQYRGRARALWQAAGTQLLAGGGIIGDIWGGIKNIGGKVADAFSSATKFLTNPGKALDDLLAKLVKPLDDIKNSGWGKLALGIPKAIWKGLKDLVTGGGSSGALGDLGAHGASARQAQAIARAMLGNYGWGQDQMAPLISLWNGESGWRWNALNASSGAYGIPQSLPASKMASAGADWRTNAATQIKWGLGYIKSRYGSPSRAWSSWLSRSPHWYDAGGWLQPGLTLAYNGTGRPEPILTGAQWDAVSARATADSSVSYNYTINARTADFTVADLQRVQRVQEARARVGRPH